MKTNVSSALVRSVTDTTSISREFGGVRSATRSASSMG
jgi:hypothetical protein